MRLKAEEEGEVAVETLRRAVAVREAVAEAEVGDKTPAVPPGPLPLIHRCGPVRCSPDLPVETIRRPALLVQAGVQLQARVQERVPVQGTRRLQQTVNVRPWAAPINLARARVREILVTSADLKCPGRLEFSRRDSWFAKDRN